MHNQNREAEVFQNHSSVIYDISVHGKNKASSLPQKS